MSNLLITYVTINLRMDIFNKDAVNLSSYNPHFPEHSGVIDEANDDFDPLELPQQDADESGFWISLLIKKRT